MRKLILLPLAISTAACVAPREVPRTVSTHGPVTVNVPNAVPPGATPRPPAELAARVASLGAGFAGTVGIAVRDVQAGWIVSYNGSRLVPQQSVSKLWVSLLVLDQVDRGLLRLDQPVTVRREDLTLFHQPIRALVGADGYTTTVRDLLTRSMTQSDCTANDKLLWLAGGPEAVRAYLAAHDIADVRFGPGERLLQTRIAGLEWKQAWGAGNGFEVARAALPLGLRQAALDRYLADPMDGASPEGLTAGLAALRKGTLLSPASTQLLLSLMTSAKTGPNRLKGGVGTDWAVAHKTGTGQELGSLATGYNDVGLLTAPDGRTYAVAVMIAATRQPIWARMQLMQNVTKAVIAAYAVAEKP